MARRNWRSVRRSFRKDARGRHWVAAELTSDTVAPGAIDEYPLVVVADYASNSNASPSGITMARMRGELVFAMSAGAADAASLGYWGIAKIETDVPTSYDPGNASDLVDERWLDTGTYYLQKNTAGGYVVPPPRTIDIRQKVRLRDDAVSLFVHCNTISTVAIRFNLIVRALLLGDIT